jgi:hypothetical protein
MSRNRGRMPRHKFATAKTHAARGESKSDLSKFLDGNESAGAHPPGFPVRLGGVNELYAVPAGRDRTRNHVWGRAVGNPGSLMVFLRQGWDTTNREIHRRLPTLLFAALTTVPNAAS